MTDFESPSSIRAALAPTAEEIRDTRFASHAGIVTELLSGKGSRALDVGCGNGKFTQILANIFTDVEGIDSSERKIEQARQTAAASGSPISFRTGNAQNLPYCDQRFDVVAFSNSLHHISDMAAALRQAARVMVPDGLLYLMEPVPAGSYFRTMKLLEDETEVRTAAYRTIGQVLQIGFTPVAEIRYRARRYFADFAEWRDEQMERGENRRLVLQRHGDEARRAFAQNAELADGRLFFDQIYRVNLLQQTI